MSGSCNAAPCETTSDSKFYGATLILNFSNKSGSILSVVMSSTAPTVISVSIADLLLAASLLITVTSKSIRRGLISNGIIGKAVVVTIF